VSDESLWIFGYGSLVWRPAFRHRRSAPASIEGWARRFWQGSTDHRGLPASPGRVVTLLSEKDPAIRADSEACEPCWGSAYEVSVADRDRVLAELDHRERGGYARIEVEITLRTSTERDRPVAGLMYVAHTDNENYLGPASVDAIAEQILGAAGPSGTNPEYVFELAASLRRMKATDRHVFSIESTLARLVRERAS
jgi:glutathione-specific gamma-glutamylcyclotransferase